MLWLRQNIFKHFEPIAARSTFPVICLENMSNLDWETQLDKKLRNKYTASFMNDTKWRELWTLIAEHSLRLSMAYADDPDWNAATLWGPFSSNLVGERGIKDPGIGGPFLYKQILSICIPKSNEQFNLFISDVSRLGQLPITESEDSFEIVAYR